MITSAYLNLWGKRVGAVAWNPTTRLGSFEYDPNFIAKGLDVSPIMMPLAQGKKRIFSFQELKDSSTFKGLPGLLADILPDKYGHALINTWLSLNGRGINSLNPIETLCFIGSRAMGALEIEPALQRESSRSSALEINSLIAMADSILNKKKQFKKELNHENEKALIDILKIGTSAGGARAKAIVAFNPKTKELRSGQANAPLGFGHYIIKFDGVMDSQFAASNGYGRVEMAYYLMAKDAGIIMSECTLLEEGKRAHFMTKRFDRVAENKKIHMQSFCALRHFDFNDVGFYSYEQLFESIRILGLDYQTKEQIFRRMVFNVLSRNCDDHTKNFAFLMDQNGVWNLAPAFDVCHAYRPGSQWVSRHSLSVNGKRENISNDDFLIVAKQMTIKKARNIVAEISNTVSKWNDYADSVQVPIKLRDAIYQTLLI